MKFSFRTITPSQSEIYAQLKFHKDRSSINGDMLMVPISGTNVGTNILEPMFKLSKRCQMSNYQTVQLWRRFTQKKFDIMRFTHIDITYDAHQKPSKCPFLTNFDDLHIWRQNWHKYVWTSLCQFFFVNLLHSPGVWFFDIWHLFDNLTSFWQFDIFLT